MMLRPRSIAVSFCAILLGFAYNHAVLPAQAVAGQQSHLDCAALVNVQLIGARITAASAVAAQDSGPVKVAHCRVSGVIDKEIRFAQLLPDRWNERLFAGGGGGFVGRVENQAIASVNLGYATVGTDTGHDADGIDARWALNNRERQVNYGYLAIHRTAEIAKAVVKAYYGAGPKYAYFFGCSNGGRQGLMEAQRFPDDFNGIVSCAPALDFTNIAASFIRNTQAVYRDPQSLQAAAITADNLRLLERKVLENCDGIEEVKDGVLDDPTECHFKTATLPACSGDVARADCVTASQRAAIERVYSPTVSNGQTIYPGQPFGGEGQPGGWQPWVTGMNTTAGSSSGPPSLEYAFGTQFFKYLALGREDWDYATYDLANWRKDTAEAATYLNAVDPDLSKFKARGGKLLLSHGWSDPALNPLSTIAYYDQLERRDPRSRDYVRLFMMPGVLHCAGGAGPDTVDWFAPIVEWVELGKAPQRLIATKRGEGDRILNTRPLCPYPQRAVYDGKGNIMQAESYACGRAVSQ
jgi:pimeloyl-ACP methyl ester carboxylesterase